MRACMSAVLLGTLFGITSALAAPAHYSLRVQGLKCAFCVYNATEQLSHVKGVQPRSVQVDLAAGTARLVSDKPLARETLSRALEQAGFRLIEMRTVSIPAAQDTVDLRTVMQLEIVGPEMDESVFGPVLEALGATIAEEGGEVRMEAPESMKKMLVKSLLMGKRVTIPLHFEPKPLQDKVLIEWQQPSEE